MQRSTVGPNSVTQPLILVISSKKVLFPFIRSTVIITHLLTSCHLRKLDVELRDLLLDERSLVFPWVARGLAAYTNENLLERQVILILGFQDNHINIIFASLRTQA